MEDSLEECIRKYLAGSASPEEVKRVEDYYNSFSGAEDYTQKLELEEKKALETKMFRNISHRLAQRGKQMYFIPAGVLRVAAVIAGLLMVSLVYVVTRSGGTIKMETAYGEVKEYVLPDNSVVTLNGNSSIEFSSWGEGEPRLVSLTGEAYFSVVHTNDHQKFVVNVPGKLQVEVLGTEFNVSARPRGASVLLNSGRVRVSGLSADSAITLKPGERVAMASSGGGVVKEVVDAERYVSWKDHKLIFDETPLKEIVATLEEIHGYTVVVEEKSLLDETFTGTIPGNDIDILILGLNKIGLDVTIHGNEIHVNKR